MSRMNWDRVKSENLRAKARDYTARMDDADERAAIEAIFDAIRFEAKQRSAGPPAVVRRSGRPKPMPLTLPRLGTIERHRLEVDAARQGITPAALLRRESRDSTR